MPDRPVSLRRAAAVVALCSMLSVGLPAHADEPAPRSPTPLEAVVARLGEETMAFDRSALWGISVLNLDTGERADFQGDQWIKAASSLKMTWLAAAIRESGLEAVEPYAESVMVWSINETAGKTIELAGGIDEVNALTRGLGMNGTLVVEWTTGTWQRSKYYPGEHPWLNYTTTDDLVTFWRWLYQGAVLDPVETDALLEWGRWRKQGLLAALVARLPEDVIDHVSYKMGLLPPGRSFEEDPEGNPIEIVGERDTILGGGVVEVPGGPTYVFAVGGFGGNWWWGKVSFVEYASCRIYEVLASETVGCDRSNDPERTRLDTDPPIGEIAGVSGGGEFVTVRGWAVDPDDPLAPILVGFEIDGARAGTIAAARRASWGAPATMVRTGHGYEATLLTLLAPGDHEVCAIAINDGAGADTPIGCRTLTVR